MENEFENCKRIKLEIPVDPEDENFEPCDSTLEPKVELVLPPENLPPEPYHPESVPPYKDRRRSHMFQAKWFKEYPWLHFDVKNQAMFCHQCLLAVNKGLFEPPTNNIFVRNGFRNWKKGAERFKVHENCQLHRDTFEFSVERRRIMTETFYAIESVVGHLKFLINQGIFLKEGSLIQLLDMRKDEMPFIEDLLKKIRLTTELEKEMVSIMSACALRNVSCRIRGCGDFGLIVDKVKTPVGEMFSLRVRTVESFSSDCFFLGLYEEQSILKELTKFLDLENLKYHSYGFYSENNNIKSNIQKLQPKALCLSSWELKLCLIIQEKLLNEKGIGNSIYIVKELERILKDTNLNFIFESLSSNENKIYFSFKTISEILKNYTLILKTLEDISEKSTSFVPSSLKDVMYKSETFFYFLITKVLIYPVENLNNIIESAQSGRGVKEAVDSVLKILQSYKEEKEFDLLWNKYLSASKYLTDSESDVQNIKKRNQTIYFKTVDFIIDYVKKLFSSKDFETLLLLENALFLKEEDMDEETERVLKSFDISTDNFAMEKSMLRKTLDSDLEEMNLEELSTKFKSFKIETVNLFPQINRLIYLLVLAPITRVCDEKAFSRSRALATFLGNYKFKELISDLSVCFVYKDDLGILNASEVAQEYVETDPVIKMMLTKS